MSSVSQESFKWSDQMVQKYPVLQRWNAGDQSEWRGGRELALLEYIKGRPDLAEIKGDPFKVLAAIDDFAYNEQFLINIGSDKGRTVTDLLAEEKPKILVELGGYIGYSAILFADAMRRSAGTNDEIHLFSLEFEEEFAVIARELVNIAGLSGLVTFVVGPAADSLRKMKAEGILDHIDFLFLDHVEELYETDLKIAEDLGLLKQGACIVADNVVLPGAPHYRHYVRNHLGLRSYAVPGLIMPGELVDELEISTVL